MQAEDRGDLMRWRVSGEKFRMHSTGDCRGFKGRVVVRPKLRALNSEVVGGVGGMLKKDVVAGGDAGKLQRDGGGTTGHVRLGIGGDASRRVFSKEQKWHSYFGICCWINKGSHSLLVEAILEQ